MRTQIPRVDYNAKASKERCKASLTALHGWPRRRRSTCNATSLFVLLFRPIALFCSPLPSPFLLLPSQRTKHQRRPRFDLAPAVVPSIKCYVSHCPYSVLTALTKIPIGTDLYINSPPHRRGRHRSIYRTIRSLAFRSEPFVCAFCSLLLSPFSLSFSSFPSLPVCTVIAAAIYTAGGDEDLNPKGK